VIEHISYEQGMVMLKESYRILAPGGRVRLATPNLDASFNCSRRRRPRKCRIIRQKMDWRHWPQTADPEGYILNHQMREWGHQFLYTPKMLRASLEAAGFRKIKQVEVGESDDPALKNVEERGDSPIKAVNAYEAMMFEAVRE
jgi:predicted SAM-dependent methyltransferase